MGNMPVPKYDNDYKPENERSPDLDHNKSKSAQDVGYFQESLYDVGDYERKDKWGARVSHQDSETIPQNRGGL